MVSSKTEGYYTLTNGKIVTDTNSKKYGKIVTIAGGKGNDTIRSAFIAQSHPYWSTINIQYWERSPAYYKDENGDLIETDYEESTIKSYLSSDKKTYTEVEYRKYADSTVYNGTVTSTLIYRQRAVKAPCFSYGDETAHIFLNFILHYINNSSIILLWNINLIEI